MVTHKVIYRFLWAVGLLWTVMAGSSVLAQAPGFIGKRFLVGVNFHISPDWVLNSDESYYQISSDSMTFGKSSQSFSFIRFIVTPCITAEYVLNRVTSIQGFFRFGLSKAKMGSGTLESSQTSRLITLYPTARTRVNLMGFGLKVRKSLGNSLSPVGKYMLFGLEYGMVKFKPEPGSFLAREKSSGKMTYYEMPARTISSVILEWGIGKTNSIGESLLLNYGLDVGLPVVLFMRESYYSSLDEYESFYLEYGSSIYKSAFFVNISVGISLLP